MKFLALEYMGNDLIWFVSWMKIPGEPRVESWDGIEPWLRTQALLHYPESNFAKGM